VLLNAGQCVEEVLHPEPLSFSVWSSLSPKSFLHVSERWQAFAGRSPSPESLPLPARFHK